MYYGSPKYIFQCERLTNSRNTLPQQENEASWTNAFKNKTGQALDAYGCINVIVTAIELIRHKYQHDVIFQYIHTVSSLLYITALNVHFLYSND